MNRFVLEALFIGAKEGLKISFCTVLVLSHLKHADVQYLKKPLFAGLLAVFLASFWVMTTHVTTETRDAMVKLIGFVFGLFYIFSIGVLFHSTGTDLLGPVKSIAKNPVVLSPLVFVLTILYCIPDMAGASLYLSDLSTMAGTHGLILFAAGVAFIACLAMTSLLVRNRELDMSSLFGLPQILLALALTKLVLGGVRGFAELSLIPAVQAGLTKLLHDIIHQIFVILMVPDHPILSTTTWNFSGFIFSPTVGIWLSLIFLVFPLVIFIKKHFSERIILPEGIAVPARKRSFIKMVRDQRLFRSIPVVVFFVFIVGLWFSEQGETPSNLFIPEPQPVSAENGRVIISLRSPVGDLRDGFLHKYSLTVGHDLVRLLVMKKPDGTLAVCLDACEICPPDGYGQGKEHVLCLYCKTPISFEALGKPGGCNPVPLSALVTDKDIRIEMNDIMEKWLLVSSGKTKAGVDR